MKPVDSQPSVPPAKAAEKALIRDHAFSENIDLTNLMADELRPNAEGLLRRLGSDEVKSLTNRASLKRVKGSVDVEIAVLKGVFNSKPNKAQFKALKHTGSSPAAPAA